MVPGRECSSNFARRFEQKISDTFSNAELDALARETEFKVRRSKITPAMFVDTILFKDIDNSAVSLEDHCIALKDRYNISVKKQSLSERFNVSAVSFIKELLNRQLNNQINSEHRKENFGNLFAHFSSVKIKDSTRFQVPECLKEHYPGSTGAATGAGVHIQFEFDILNGKVNALEVTDALRQDVTDAQATMDAVKKGDLIIRDLGYFSTSVLEHIHRNEAFYITRTKSKMNFFHADTEEKVDFNGLYRKMKRHKLAHIELPVIIGKGKIINRLVAELLPEIEVQKRIKKASREAKKKGSTLSDEYKSRARLNLFITNIPTRWMATSQIRKTYQIRWQIELRFKAWKTFYRIDAVKKMQRHRFECYLFSTLLLIMINTEIGNNFFAILWRTTSTPISFMKFFKTTSQQLRYLRQGIMQGGETFIDYLMFLYELCHDKLITEHRKNHSAALIKILTQNVE